MDTSRAGERVDSDLEFRPSTISRVEAAAGTPAPLAPAEEDWARRPAALRTPPPMQDSPRGMLVRSPAPTPATTQAPSGAAAAAAATGMSSAAPSAAEQARQEQIAMLRAKLEALQKKAKVEQQQQQQQQQQQLLQLNSPSPGPSSGGRLTGQYTPRSRSGSPAPRRGSADSGRPRSVREVAAAMAQSKAAAQDDLRRQVRCPPPVAAPAPPDVHGSACLIPWFRDAACPLSTRGGTRLVRLVPGRGGGGGEG